MPIDRRSRPSEMPALARASALMAAWVIVAGCATRLSTPPSDSARVNQRSESTKARTARSVSPSGPAASSKLSIAPKPACWRAATAWPGCDSRPGKYTFPTAACPSSSAAIAAAFSWCTRMRASSVRSPRRVRKLSNGEPVRPSALAHHTSCWCSSGSRATTAPPTTSLWPLTYLVVECRTRSAPNASGFCSAGDRNVLSTTASAPARCAASITRRRSVMRRSGLDGVSTSTSFGDWPSASASERGSVRSAVISSKWPLAASALNRRQLPP